MVLAGGCNVMPTDADIYATVSGAKDILLQLESRAASRRLLDQGWTDALRVIHPPSPLYNFWHYKRSRQSRDAGLRLDHILPSPSLPGRLENASLDRSICGQDGASDHAPTWVSLEHWARWSARLTSASIMPLIRRSPS